MDSLSTFVQSPLFSRLSVVLGGLIVVGLFWWRAGSIHTVLDRLWRLVAGKADVHDPVLKSLLLESRDIEKFQFIYRLKVETMVDVHKLAAWMETRGVGMARLQKIRRWVDVTSAEVVSQPPRHYVRSHCVFGCMAMLTILGISQLAASHDAYLQMRTSKVWFKTDAVTVKAPLEGWSFNLAKCQDDRTKLANLTGFNASETNAICNAFKDDRLKALVNETVKWQAWTGIVGMLIAIFVAIINILAAGAAHEALRLRKRLYPAGVGGNGSDVKRTN
ncbi:DUF6216 family protein [Pandoraea vervacti]|uniref:DUF6216 family protein n=1 Tax=Pandoraea vervacti TaxID=656178 RepID=UPI0012F4A863|nr:DUF6216 family protein [Pandoraea vervacti]